MEKKETFSGRLFIMPIFVSAVVFVAVLMLIAAKGTLVNSADLNYTASITEAKTVQVELSPENDSAFSVRTKVTYNETTGQMTEFIISPRQVPELFSNGNVAYSSYEYTPDNGLAENFQIVIELSDGNKILTADDLHS